MAQMVSCLPLDVEVRVRFQASPCKSCSGGSGTGTVFSAYFVYPLVYHSNMAPYLFAYSFISKRYIMLLLKSIIK
jgi:hypothetical protein